MFTRYRGVKIWLMALGLSFSAMANAAYPDHSIRVILPYAAGAAGDIVFRVLQPGLTKALGQPVILDYKSGAGGNIGTQEVVRAAPDGYTLLLGATNNFVINQFLYKSMSYDPSKALVPIAKVVDVPAFIYLNAKVPAHNFAQFKFYAEKHAGILNYGTPGAGTTPALSGWMLSEAVRGNMTAVTYRGSAPGVQALLANQIQVYIGGYGIASAYLPSGKLRVLAVALPERFAALPNVPTTKEVGIGNAVVSNWWGMAAPKGTPAAVVERVEQALHKVLSDPVIQKKLQNQGFVVSLENTATFTANLRKEAPYWEDVIKRAGVVVN
ncbi:MAG: tripartite tricarboxylate transporter substrate binding protein [Candidimonas sp.]|nr:MAG: tripartite tricarboxylate transporter substrate binding protein [Candidimonas sp.]TAM22555.1 MAG: tripartite tricarboxylate transporter substrate binding protein [Candidimonas sp.]TAM75959.1 MAG: tripartite tricarboxylate transporter substrate binding protein [Candidimonas sp.]